MLEELEEALLEELDKALLDELEEDLLDEDELLELEVFELEELELLEALEPDELLEELEDVELLETEEFSSGLLSGVELLELFVLLELSSELFDVLSEDVGELFSMFGVSVFSLHAVSDKVRVSARIPAKIFFSFIFSSYC